MYRIQFSLFNKPITPELTRLDDSFRGIPKANGKTVKNGRELISLIGTPDFDPSTMPIFDYFHLETYDKDKKLWEWCLNDIHQIEGLYSPSCMSLFISPKVKDIFTRYIIAQPSGYVLSKLKYQRDYLDYYIFYCTPFCTFNDVLYNKTSFQIFTDSSKKILIGNYEGKVENFDEFETAKAHSRQKYDGLLDYKSVLLKKYYDFFMLYGDPAFYVSERLKNVLEENGITGIEFVEETDTAFHFLETPPAIGNSLLQE